MKPVFEEEHLALIELIQGECHPEQMPFIVGGAVRDALLGKPLHDLDFVMAEQPIELAKWLANRLKAGFFVLDDERQTARVVYYDRDGRYFPLDFVQFTGANLQEDLHNRDFTINAMALSVKALNDVIDPLNGQSDLQRGILRACSDHALTDDPVRVLRGVRLAIQFGFDYDSGLPAALRAAAGLLPKTSFERQRDEFFRILEGPNPAEGLRHCHRFEAFRTLIPALHELAEFSSSEPHSLPLFEHTLSTVENYHALLSRLIGGQGIPEKGDVMIREALDELGRFSDPIAVYFNEEITPRRSKSALAYLGALLHEVGKATTATAGDDERWQSNHHTEVGAELADQATKRLQLSNAESDWVRRLVRGHLLLQPFVESGSPPDRRAIFRFYKETGDAGVAIVLHTLADRLSTLGMEVDPGRWGAAISVAGVLLSAWWDQHEMVVSPQPLLDGHDLQQIFGLEPGPRIGRLLSQLIEAQASGAIHTTEEALDFVRQRLET